MLTKMFPCLQELPPTEPVEQGDEGKWDMVGEATGSPSLAPTVEELLAQMERQPPAHQESTEPATTAAAEEVVAAEAQESTAPTAVIAEDEAQEEAPTEGGLVDIASILGASTVTVVQSSL
jgi:hypothetical protein